MVCRESAFSLYSACVNFDNSHINQEYGEDEFSYWHVSIRHMQCGVVHQTLFWIYRESKPSRSRMSVFGLAPLSSLSQVQTARHEPTGSKTQNNEEKTTLLSIPLGNHNPIATEISSLQLFLYLRGSDAILQYR